MPDAFDYINGLAEENALMTQEEALQKARDIVGRTREIQGRLYTDDATERHEKLDKFLLDLLKDDYPELVDFVKRLKLWYG